MKTSEEVINEIMDYFNFEKVAKTMQVLNWEWRDNGVPDIYEIKRFARQIMKECYDYSIKDKQSKRLSSGGFYVFSEFEDGIFTGIELSFILESFDVFTD